MKATIEICLCVLLAGMLAAIHQLLGPKITLIAAGLSGTWFVIAFVLLTRPPGIPEFVSEETGSDEQHVIRKDVIPKLPVSERFRIALGAACGSCFLLWMSLTFLRQ